MPTSVPAQTDFDVAVIDGFAIDCLLSDNHTFEADVTEYPVESGSTIADNIRNRPLVVQMECLISNTPLERVGLLRDAGSVPEKDAYNLMLAIRRDRRLVDIQTSLRGYANMALQALSIPRAAGRADGLLFSATFKQVEIVQNKRGVRVAIPGAMEGGARLFTPTLAKYPGSISINLFDFTWYDPEILGWRETFELKRPGQSTIFPVEEGQALLLDERPLDIPAEDWNNERVDAHTLAQLRPRIKKAQGGKTRPMLEGKSLSLVQTLYPGQYKIVRLLPVTG